MQPSRPDVVYAHIVPSQKPENTSNTDRATNDSVLYSELQNKDNDNHTVAPSGDLYAQVQKS